MSAHAATRKPTTMTKALAAVGAAAVLGAGLFTANGGSFALWSDDAEIGNDITITAGDLDLETRKGKWTVNDEAKPPHYRMVPGDTLTYTQDIKLTAKGSFKANISVEVPGLTSDNEELAKVMNDNAWIGAANLGGSTLVAADGYSLPVNSTNTALVNKWVEVTLTITMPEELESGQNATINFDGATVTATQTTNTQVP